MNATLQKSIIWNITISMLEISWKIKMRNSNCIKSLPEDKTVLVRPGRTALPDLLRELYPLKLDLKSRKASNRCIPDRIVQLVRDLQTNGLIGPFNFVHDQLKYSALRRYCCYRKMFPLVASAYCSECATKTISNITCGGSVLLEKLWKQKRCRIVALPSFHGWGRKCLDVILMDNSKDNIHAVRENMCAI